jgi:hypothetical protein
MTIAEREHWVAVLQDAIDGMHDMFSYVPDYFRGKWKHQDYINRAEKALADLLDGDTDD